MNQIRVTFLNQLGAGYGKKIMVEENTTIDAFLEENLGENYDAERLRIRVNRDVVKESYVLQSEDRIEVVPVNQKGA